MHQIPNSPPLGSKEYQTPNDPPSGSIEQKSSRGIKLHIPTNPTWRDLAIFKANKTKS